jgi:galactonate dehydratase
MEDFYETSTDNVKKFAELAVQAVEEGFTAFKSMAVPSTMSLEGNAPVKSAELCVQAMREAVGENVDIMVDCHARPSPAMGLLFAKALEPYNLYFFEEPCWPESIEGLAQIQRSVKTPIATGERLSGLQTFQQLLEKRACSVIQPDVTHCGGLTTARKLAALAEAYLVSMAPHNPQGPVSTAASIELGLSTPQYIICETVSNDVPWRDDIVKEGLTIEKERRIVRPGNKPGLGIEINESEVNKHPFRQEIPQRVFYKDGSVGDW